MPTELIVPVLSVTGENGVCATAMARSPTRGVTVAKVSGVRFWAPTAWSRTTPWVGSARTMVAG